MLPMAATTIPKSKELIDESEWILTQPPRLTNRGYANGFRLVVTLDGRPDME